MEIETLLPFPKYPEYRPSGVEWINQIPANWAIFKMKYLFKDLSLKNRPEAELLSVTQDKGVIPRSMVEDRMVMPTANLDCFKFIQKGDFAISLRSFEGGLEYCKYDGIISPAYTVLRKQNSKLKGEYYKYLFKSISFISEIQTSVVGIREGKNISYEQLSYSLIPVPKVEEQSTIASFLSKKTAKIDRAIAIKEKQIELLKERRQIMIQQAVTKGLNPNVKMKDSGVEWIGEVPEHWDLVRLKYVAKIKYGLGQPPKEKHGGIPIIRATNIDKGKIVSKGLIFVDPNDVPWDRDPAGAIAGYDMVMTPQLINADFLALGMLSSYVLYNQLYLLRMRAAQPHLNAEELGETLIIRPTPKEQHDIISYIKAFSSKVERYISLHEQQIEKLKEYKTVLIDAAVTGKIKVC